MTDSNKRPTKKQKQLLDFIKQFVEQNGYGPSYRDIMKGCDYSSVATVAAHVSNLIAKGHLKKNGRSARSLELADAPNEPKKLPTNQVKPAEEKWLVDKIDYHFKRVEAEANPSQADIDGLYVLCGALKVLGSDGASQSFSARLSKIKGGES